MAWDENVCANSPAPEFQIPKDKSAKEILLEILGYEEATLTVEQDGEEVTMTILRKKTDSGSKVCSAKVCGSTVAC